jgi:hypothetical protein
VPKLAEADAMLPPLLVQLADGREAGTVVVVDQHAAPEASVLSRGIGP